MKKMFVVAMVLLAATVCVSIIVAEDTPTASNMKEFVAQNPAFDDDMTALSETSTVAGLAMESENTTIIRDACTTLADQIRVALNSYSDVPLETVTQGLEEAYDGAIACIAGDYALSEVKFSSSGALLTLAAEKMNNGG